MKIPVVDFKLGADVSAVNHTIVDLHNQRTRLMDEIRRINAKIRNLDAFLGFNGILYMDVLREMDDIEIYKCRKCDTQWASYKRIPCQKCYSDSYAAIGAYVLREIDYNPQTSTSYPG